MSPEQLQLEILQKLEEQNELGTIIKAPPEAVLAKGGHVLVCIVGLQPGIAMGLKHFCKRVGDIRYEDPDSRM